MVKRTKYEELHIGRIHNLQVLSYGLIVAIFIGSASFRKEAFLSLWVLPDSPEGIPLFLARTFLFFNVAFFVLQWVAATANEFTLWERWLKYQFVPSHVYLSMCGLIISLGLMILLVYDVTVFAGYLSCFFLLHYWSQWISNTYFARAYESTNKNQHNQKALAVLHHYFLELPQLGRIVTMLFFSMVAFGIALSASGRDASTTRLLHEISHAILGFTIFIGELIILIWRYRRDRDLRQVLTKASE